MPVKSLPKDRNWVPDNVTQYGGSMSDNFNISLSRKHGFVTASLPLIPHTTSSDTLATTLPSALIVDGANDFYMASDTVYMTGNITTTKFTADATSGNPTLTYDADLILCDISGSVNQTIPITTGVSGGASYIYAKKLSPSSVWAQLGGALETTGSYSASNSYRLAQIGRSLFSTDGKSSIHQTIFNQDGTTTRTNGFIMLPYSLIISWMKVCMNQLFIGCLNGYHAGKMVVYRYDPFSLQQYRMVLSTSDATPFIVGDNIFLIDTKGRILQYNGTTFANTGLGFPGSNFDNTLIKLPHRNGISTADGLVKILMPSTYPYVLGGVWTLDIDNKCLYHEFGIRQSISNYDYGTTNVTSAGALMKSSSFSSGLVGIHDGEFLCGAVIKTSATVSLTGIFTNGRQTGTNSSTGKRAWFMTPRITSEDGFIDTQWKNVVAKYIYNMYPNGTVASSNIRIGYRTTEPPFSSLTAQDTCTWVDTDTYTVAATQLSGVAVGDRVFITNGRGAGAMSYIASMTGTTTKTVNLDTTIATGGSGTFNVVYDNFNALGGYVTLASKEWEMLDIPEDAVGDWIQFLVEIVGDTGVEGIATGFQNNLPIEQ